MKIRLQRERERETAKCEDTITERERERETAKCEDTITERERERERDGKM